MMGIIREFVEAYKRASLEAQPIERKEYGGVPLSELNSLAKTIRDGRVKTDGKYLYFDFRSRSGRFGNTIKYRIEGNKLSKMTSRYYPGQSFFPEDDFMEEANKRFFFVEE